MKPVNTLWNDFRQGKNYALSEIYFNNIQLLYQYGKKFSTDNELIKDTIQDLFCDLIKNCKNLGETDNIPLYLITSFRRRLFHNLRKKNIIIPDPEKEKEPESNFVEKLIEKEQFEGRGDAIKKAIDELTYRQREILFYRFTCNFNYEQICGIMDLKYDSARKLVHRSLQSLKKILVTSESYPAIIKSV